MAQIEIDVLVWESKNRLRRVYYNSDGQTTGSIRSIDTADEPIDAELPMEPVGAATPSRTYAAGEQMRPAFCEGTDQLTLTAKAGTPYATIAVAPNAPYCTAPAGNTCDLYAQAISATESSVTVAVTTSHGPFYSSIDNITYVEDQTTFGGLSAGVTYPLYFRDEANCRFQLSVGVDEPPPPGVPEGELIDSFEEGGETIGLYYQRTPSRTVVFYSPSGRVLVGPVAEAVRNRTAGSLFSPRTICEGTTQIEFTATLTRPFAQVVATANRLACGYVPPIDPTDPTDVPGPILAVLQQPAAWAPVHLPVLLLLSVKPGPEGEAREVVCYVDASSDNGGTWAFCGVLRRTAGGNKLVSFNLSEYLKSQFPITPPLTGADPALSLRWRVRLGLAADFAGGPTGELLRLDTGRVVNGAAANGGTGTYLSDQIPLPAGYGYRLSKIGTQAVTNELASPGTTPAECPPYPLRLVWLNQRGGWNSYVFGGRHRYGTSTGGGVTYTDATRARRYADRGPVVPTMDIFSDRLTPGLAALVRTVRESIQVYELTPDGQYVPVLVAENGYADYRADDKAPTVDFSLTYPARPVQTQ